MIARIPKDFCTAEFVFIRHDPHQNALCSPNDDLFHVLEAGVKTLLIDFGDRPGQVLVDRLRSALGELDQLMGAGSDS